MHLTNLDGCYLPQCLQNLDILPEDNIGFYIVPVGSSFLKGYFYCLLSSKYYLLRQKAHKPFSYT